MALMETPICDFGRPAIDFSLPDINGVVHSLDSCKGKNGLLVMFICNHCPYVKAIQERLVRDTRELQQHGIESVAIMSNDVSTYADDSPENMKAIAERFNFPFPYLFDESQQVARAYGAICTPDFFGYNSNLELQYRGRLDASGKKQDADDSRRDLFEAMKQVSMTGNGPEQQIPSIGCSLKWKTD
jgi:peroxiredoxin